MIEQELSLFRQLIYSHGLLLTTIVTMALATTVGVEAATSAVLVDRDLKPQPVRLQGVADGWISYFDADRRLQVEPIEQFVLMRQIRTSPEPVDPQTTSTDRDDSSDRSDEQDGQVGVIELIDGQRLTGRWIGGDASGEKLIWHHALLGEVMLDLEQIAGIVPHGRLPKQYNTTAQPSDDRVVLANGDTLDGFVSRIDSEGLVFVPNGDDRSLVLPVDRLQSIIMANGGVNRYQPDRCLVWLADGSRLETRTIEMTADHASLEPVLISATPIRTVPVHSINRIDLAVADGYLVDLVDLPMRVTAGGSSLGLPLPPRLADSSVWMHAPVTVVYELPNQATRFSATAMVASEQAPSFARAWTDFEVIIRAANQVASSHRLTDRKRKVAINTRLLGRQLAIELIPGNNGPIMDRMMLHNALVLVRQSAD